MKKINPLGTRALFLPLALCLLLVTPTLAGASEVDKLNGTWVVDIDATLDLLMQQGSVPAEMVSEVRGQLASLKVTYDIPGKKFTGEYGGEKASVMTIDSITENPDGTIRITGEQQDDTYRFRPDGTLLVVHAGIVLKKAQ